VLVESAPVLWVPLAARVPLQPPEAVQAVAFIELQVSIDADPLLTGVGDTVNAAVGGADGLSPPPHAAISSRATAVE
jgi:hypothetical protein